jgi:hypothetical protein
MRQFFSDIPLLLIAAFGIGWLVWGFWFHGPLISTLISVPLVLCSLLVTLGLPVIIAFAYAGRFRLWHVFVWITLFAVVLAWLTQTVAPRKPLNRPSATGLNSR